MSLKQPLRRCTLFGWRVPFMCGSATAGCLLTGTGAVCLVVFTTRMELLQQSETQDEHSPEWRREDRRRVERQRGVQRDTQPEATSNTTPSRVYENMQGVTRTVNAGNKRWPSMQFTPSIFCMRNTKKRMCSHRRVLHIKKIRRAPDPGPSQNKPHCKAE